MKLTTAEEELMNYLWSLKCAFMKDLLEAYPEPKPASTTISTLLKRMQEKKFVGYRTYGNSREYFPIVTKESYFSKHINTLIKTYFNDSPAQFASFFTEQTKLTEQELLEIKARIDHLLNIPK
jgi:predicted transcriptional regulator